MNHQWTTLGILNGVDVVLCYQRGLCTFETPQNLVSADTRGLSLTEWIVHPGHAV